MSNVQVLVATRNQNDFSLIDKMNNKTCDFIIANQCNFERIDSYVGKGIRGMMISTKTKGVGLNRNISLCFASADIFLFSDDDVCFYEGFDKIIERAFSEYKKADVICFGTEFTKNGITYKKLIPHKGKLGFIKSLKQGTYSLAIKKNSLIKNNLNFTLLFGGGCLYSRGEDTDFIVQCYKKGLKVYSQNEIICSTSKDESTSFNGYNEKYYYDLGAFGKHSFGFFFRQLYFFRTCFKKSDSNLSFWSKFLMMKNGSKGYKELLNYDDYLKKNLKD